VKVRKKKKRKKRKKKEKKENGAVEPRDAGKSEGHSGELGVDADSAPSPRRAG
jgi:hypothetical protein